MKKIILGTAVAVVGIGVAGAWYTGQKLPEVLDTAVVQANEELAKSLSLTGISARIELESLESHFFNSTARYRLQVSDEVDGEEGLGSHTFHIVDQIEHGPFPLSRLTTLKWLPVMITSNYQLESSPELEKWFAATKGVSPLSGQATLGYTRSVSGNLKLEPVKAELEDGGEVDFAGFVVNFKSNADISDVVAEGVMDSFKFSAPMADGAEQLVIDLQGMTYTSDLKLSENNLYVGQNDIRLKSLTASVNDDAVHLGDVQIQDDSNEKDGKLYQRVSYKTDAISFKNHDIGSAQLVLAVKDLDAKVAGELVKMLSEIQFDSTYGEAELTDDQKLQLEKGLLDLLEGKPGIGIEKLVLKTASGESEASFNLGLAKPASMDLSPPALAEQLINRLDLNISVSKKTIADLVALQAKLDGVTEQQQIDMQAKMLSDMASTMATSTSMAELKDDAISSQLSYADGKVTLNGKDMSLDQFMGLVMGAGAGVGMMGIQP